MKILVTGCAGFIGWKVCELLLNEGHTVIGVDNLDNAYDVRLKEWRLAQLQKQKNFTSYRLDITDRLALSGLFDGSSHPFDAVINLAAKAGVRRSVADPWGFMEVNVMGTLNLLEGCRKFGVRKFILASTSSLYGENEHQLSEDQPTDRPISPYAASKKAAEALCHTYHHLYGLDISVLRYFTVYGPCGRPDMSIFRFIRWIAEDEPVIFYGDGFQRRDFTFVDDVARGTLLALKPLGYEVINLGSDRPVSLREVVGILEGLLEKKAQIRCSSRDPADVSSTWADISRAKQVLGWEPGVSLEEGLRQAAEWYLENREWAREIVLH